MLNIVAIGLCVCNIADGCNIQMSLLTNCFNCEHSASDVSDECTVNVLFHIIQEM